MPATLYDDFANPLGEFPNYDTYDPTQRTQLARQKHVDLRSFQQDPILIPYTLFALDHFSLGDLTGLTMAQLEAASLLVSGENWTAGSFGPQADRKQFQGMSLTCPHSATTLTSSVTAAIDLSAFDSTDYISLSLPALPLASLTLSQCFLDLTSEPSGNFATGPTDSLALSTSTTTLVAGDSEARFPLSRLTTINRGRITGVRFRIVATGDCTFRCLAIRCLATTWEYPPIDLNTLYDRIQASPPPSGSITQPYNFPPTGWPILLRSDGADGPLVVDSETGVIIHAGLGTAANSLTLYFRELPMVVETMTSLDLLTIGDLEDLHRQPDYLPAVLDGLAETKYLAVTLAWGTTNTVAILDETATGYTFAGPALTPGQDYYLLVTLVDHSLRVQLYPCSVNGVVDRSTVAFDSTAVIDDSFIRRRRGRVGWTATLGEGDTYLRALRPRRAVYSEYRSLPFRSPTPVEGAQLFVSSTPSVELYNGSVATPGVVLSPDISKSRSGRCIKVQCDGQSVLEGLVTGAMRFENFYNTSVEFDVLAPSSARLTALLSGEGRLISLFLPPFATNRWTHMSIPLTLLGTAKLPGPYSLYVLQTHTAQNTWYIDNLSVRTAAVSWAGRGQAADPWQMNDPTWVNFGTLLNNPVSGAMLGRGNALQVQGQALTADAALDSVTVLPRYATLGNFVWFDQELAYSASPVAVFTTAPTAAAHEISLDASGSTADAGITNYYWTFGDETHGYGETLFHTYAAPGTYVVSVTVIDTLGLKTTTSASVVVT